MKGQNLNVNNHKLYGINYPIWYIPLLYSSINISICIFKINLNFLLVTNIFSDRNYYDANYILLYSLFVSKCDIYCSKITHYRIIIINDVSK